MKCELPEELLTGYLDNELNEEERIKVEKHLSRCRKCRYELETLKKVDTYVKMATIEAPSQNFVSALNEHIIKRIRKKRRHLSFRLFPILAPAFVGLLLIIILLNTTQQKRVAGLNDLIPYPATKTLRGGREESVKPQMPVLYLPSAPALARVTERKTAVTQTEADNLEKESRAILFSENKVVRAIIDSTGTIIKVATGRGRQPEKDTMLEHRFQGKKISPPFIAGKKTQVYIEFAPRKGEEN